MGWDGMRRQTGRRSSKVTRLGVGGRAAHRGAGAEEFLRLRGALMVGHDGVVLDPVEGEVGEEADEEEPWADDHAHKEERLAVDELHHLRASGTATVKVSESREAQQGWGGRGTAANLGPLRHGKAAPPPLADREGARPCADSQ